jgi:D-sedoheptulose 7-phosphate isomerase
MASGGKLMLCGNGGSAGDSQHIAAEFVSLLDRSFERPGLPALALTTDTSLITASANDFGFEGIFARQAQALGNPGDCLMGISTSGSSANVVEALKWAGANDIYTLAMTGRSGDTLAGLAETTIMIPHNSVQLIQEAHIAVGHIICALVEHALFADKKG